MMGFGMGGAGFIFMVIFWVVVIALAMWLLSYLFPRMRNDASSQHTAGRGDSPESPLEILRQRYAQGEISKTEFEEKRRDLGG